MGGTPEFLMNTRRGLYSYEALQSRLAENTFARDGLVDLSGPVIRLASLTPEDLFVLLANIRAVMQGDEPTLPDTALEAFMAHCSDRIGEAYFRTPRNTVTAFVNLLAVLEQNPGVEWSDLIEGVDVVEDSGDDMSDVDESIGAVPVSDELTRNRQRPPHSTSWLDRSRNGSVSKAGRNCATFRRVQHTC
jgi:hypothetical protein